MATTNDFVSLEVPATPATGAPSDISGISNGLSLIVQGPASSDGRIVVEISGDGTNFAPVTSISPINNPSGRFLNLAARFARIRRLSGTGPAFAALGGARGDNDFGTLSLNPLDTSEMGPFKTIIVSGPYTGKITVEGSVDGTNFDAIATIDTQGSGVLNIIGTWAALRIQQGAILENVVINMIASLDSSSSLLRAQLATNDVDGLGLDMVGIIHERDFLVFPPEITNAMNALIFTKQRAEQAIAFATGALARGFLKDAAFVTANNVNTQPPGVKQISLEFNEGVALPADARFITAQFRQVEAFDNVGHSLIEASIGVIGDLEKYAAKVPINNPANDGKTSTSTGSANLILLAPIDGDVPFVTIYSADDLETIIQGLLGLDLFYTTP